MRISAIDIGSNAMRMIIGEVVLHRVYVIKKVRASVRLGHDVFLDGKISEQTLSQAQKALKEFSSLNKKFKVRKCLAVGTSALREAKNRQEFVKKVFGKSRIRVSIINGTKEAGLIFKAVAQEVDLTDKKVALIDIGGGSVEVTICRGEKIVSTQSFPLGTVRLLETLNKQHLSEDELPAVIKKLTGPLLKFMRKNQKGQLDFAVGTGGNLEAMARLKTYLLKKTPNTFLTLKELEALTKILRRYTVKQRILKLGLRPDRADVIIPAIMVVKTILRQSGADRLVIPCVGLRDGLLTSAAGI